MLVLPGRDKFQMGSPASEADRKDWPDDIAERSHERSIPRTFAIAATEVTIEQFDRFRQSEGYREYEPFAKADDAVRGKYALHAQSTCPITVTWYEAAAYCNWLSERDNHRTKGERCYPTAADTFRDGMVMPEGYLQRAGYRLPTEAEWEYACRANAATSRYFGETDELLEKYAWYRTNTFERGMRPVGTLKPNDFGLFDMLGNASEWCQSKLQPYPKTAAKPVQDIEEADPIADRDERVLRGAAYVSVPAKLRSAMRLGSAPNERGTLSFRVARTLGVFSPNPD